MGSYRGQSNSQSVHSVVIPACYCGSTRSWNKQVKNIKSTNFCIISWSRESMDRVRSCQIPRVSQKFNIQFSEGRGHQKTESGIHKILYDCVTCDHHSYINKKSLQVTERRTSRHYLELITDCAFYYTLRKYCETNIYSAHSLNYQFQEWPVVSPSEDPAARSGTEPSRRPALEPARTLS